MLVGMCDKNKKSDIPLVTFEIKLILNELHVEGYFSVTSAVTLY